MHLNSMPDLVLRRIFSKLPLTGLILAGRVCLLWKSYQLDITRKIDSLTLLFGSPDARSLITNSCFTLKYRDLLLNDDGKRMHSSQYLNQYFHVIYGSFKLACSAELLNIFPHITTLEIAIKFAEGRKIALTPIATLLVRWSPMLKSLKLYLQCDYSIEIPSLRGLSRLQQPIICAREATSNELVNLLTTINSMQSLEHLTLDSGLTSIMPFLEKEGRPLDLPILGRLRAFFFNSNDSIDIIEKSLKCYAVPNDNLKQIGLEFIQIFTGRDLDLRFPQLLSRMVYIPSRTRQFYLPALPNRLHEFSSLVYLHFRHDGFNLPFNGELNSLASLPQLKHLHYEANDCVFPASLQRNQLRQLSSIQVLTLSVSWKATYYFESNLWAHLFPNVQVLELNIASSSYLFLSKQQLRKPLSAFVQCPKLHHIYTREMFLPNCPVLVFEWIVLQVRDSRIIINV